MNNYDYMFKLILIGDSSVGKSCLLTRLTEDFFKSESDPTIGVEFGTKVLKSSSGLNVRIQVWDTAGQENFRSITQSYYWGAIGAFIVFDLTQRKSYENVGKWIKDARQFSSSENFELILVGNKSDLNQMRKITKEESRVLAADENILYIETSAKSGQNVEKCFKMMVDQILIKIENGIIDLEKEEGIWKRVNSEQKSTLENKDKDAGKSRKCVC